MFDNLEELYSSVPPTKLRNQEEKFKPAKTSAFWMWVADRFFYGMLENRFFAFRYKGIENFENLDPDVPTIAYAPHSNWWDGIVGYNITTRLFNKEIRLMVEELNRFPLLRRAGAFSVNKKSPQASMRALKYASEVIGDKNCVLYLFPQGIIKPPNFRPLEFQTGLAYVAGKAMKKFGKVNILPIAVNYFFLRADRPEVLAEIGKPIVLDSNETPDIDRKEYTKFLEKTLEELCDNQDKNVSLGQFKGYKTLFQQKLRWYRKIEQRLKKINVKGSGV